jgi:hypothetical protein
MNEQQRFAMPQLSRLALCQSLMFAAFAGVAWVGTAGKDGGPTGAFTYSNDPNVAAVQCQVKAVVERYQEGLNSSNFAIIRPLFAHDAVSEWNDKATVIGPDAMSSIRGVVQRD